MTTGIPTVSSMWYYAYYLLILAILVAFAIYDIFKKRVLNKALVCFIPIAFPAPFVNSAFIGTGAVSLSFFATPFLHAVLGTAMGFFILLATAITSKVGDGIGGGDIKLTAILGFIYGLHDIISILLIASLLAMPASLHYKRKSGSQPLRLAFVPFLTIGCFITTIMKLSA